MTSEKVYEVERGSIKVIPFEPSAVKSASLQRRGDERACKKSGRTKRGTSIPWKDRAESEGSMVYEDVM